MKLLAVAGDIRATIAGIRLVQPLQALAAAAGGHELRLRSLHECTPADLAWADALILQRPITSAPGACRRACRRSARRYSSTSTIC